MNLLDRIIIAYRDVNGIFSVLIQVRHFDRIRVSTIRDCEQDRIRISELSLKRCYRSNVPGNDLLDLDRTLVLAVVIVDRYFSCLAEFHFRCARRRSTSAGNVTVIGCYAGEIREIRISALSDGIVADGKIIDCINSVGSSSKIRAIDRDRFGISVGPCDRHSGFGFLLAEVFVVLVTRDLFNDLQ